MNSPKPPPARPTLPIDRRAAVERTVLDATSWLDVTRRFVREPDPLFEQLERDIPWTQGHSIREGRKVPNPRLGGSLSRNAQETIPALKFSRLALEARYRVRLGGAAMVMYRDGRDSVGFHRDDEMLYLERTVIAAVCLGASRPVMLRKASGTETHTFDLGEGDLYVMGGRCQADWVHAVPKVESSGPRMSVIWRWSARVGPPSSSPSRFVADAPKKRRPR